MASRRPRLGGARAGGQRGATPRRVVSAPPFVVMHRRPRRRSSMQQAWLDTSWRCNVRVKSFVNPGLGCSATWIRECIRVTRPSAPPPSAALVPDWPPTSCMRRTTRERRPRRRGRHFWPSSRSRWTQRDRSPGGAQAARRRGQDGLLHPTLDQVGEGPAPELHGWVGRRDGCVGLDPNGLQLAHRVHGVVGSERSVDSPGLAVAAHDLRGLPSSEALEIALVAS